MKENKYKIYYCEDDNLIDEFYKEVNSRIAGSVMLKGFIDFERELKYCVNKDDITTLLKTTTKVSDSLRQEFYYFDSFGINYELGVKDEYAYLNIDKDFITHSLTGKSGKKNDFAINKANLEIRYNEQLNTKVKTENSNEFIELFLEQRSDDLEVFSKYIFIDYLLKNTEDIIKNKSFYNHENTIINIIKPNNVLKWHGSKIDLIELSKALIENGTLKGTQKDIINSLGAFFSVDTTNQDKTINDLKKRNNGSETKFLEDLKSNLYNYITKENIR